jgi:hypothetical protein
VDCQRAAISDNKCWLEALCLRVKKKDLKRDSESILLFTTFFTMFIAHKNMRLKAQWRGIFLQEEN